MPAVKHELVTNKTKPKPSHNEISNMASAASAASSASSAAAESTAPSFDDGVKFLGAAHLALFDTHVVTPSYHFMAYAHELQHKNKTYSNNVLQYIQKLHGYITKLRFILAPRGTPSFMCTTLLGTAPEFSQREVEEWTNDRDVLFQWQVAEIKKKGSMPDALAGTDHESWMGAALYATIVLGMQRVYMYGLLYASFERNLDLMRILRLAVHQVQTAFGNALADTVELCLYEAYDPSALVVNINIENLQQKPKQKQKQNPIEEKIEMQHALPYMRMLRYRKTNQKRNWTDEDQRLMMREHVVCLPIDVFEEMILLSSSAPSTSWDDEILVSSPLSWDEMVRLYSVNPLHDHEWKNKFGKNLQVCMEFAPILNAYEKGEKSDVSSSAILNAKKRAIVNAVLGKR